MSDNWLTDGNCEECRRKSYCKTECKKHREWEMKRLYRFMSVELRAYYRTLAEHKSED